MTHAQLKQLRNLTPIFPNLELLDIHVPLDMVLAAFNPFPFPNLRRLYIQQTEVDSSILSRAKQIDNSSMRDDFIITVRPDSTLRSVFTWD